MNDLITAIAFWCSGFKDQEKIVCQETIFACVMQDKRLGDSKEWLEMKLQKCLGKKNFNK